MLTLTSANSYYLCTKSVNMQNSFDGLFNIVSSGMKRNPLSGEVFIFMNKPHNRIKFLHWERGGFVIYYKRLEKGTFKQPLFENGVLSRPLKWTELVLMIEGISIDVSLKFKKRYEVAVNC